MTQSDTSDQVALTALVIAVVALCITSLQVLQQYAATADGYRRCNASYMGLWSKATRRRFMWKELRFEVAFETPVLFVGHPSSSKPLPDLEGFCVDGTQQSCEETRCDAVFLAGKNSGRPRVTSSSDAKAPWMILLNALHNLEYRSRLWEQRLRTTKKADSNPEYLLYLQVQRQQNSWDLMPPTIFQPFATTSLCTLVEVVGMLGMKWTQFDVDNARITASGNGYILTSSLVPGLGILIGFSRTGVQTSKFNRTRAFLFRETLFGESENPAEITRVIPTLAVKQLVFGVVPTVLGQWWPTLDFGEDNISKTLTRYLGLTEEEQKSRYDYHDFPVIFQLIGMLSQVFRVHGSLFRMLPSVVGQNFSTSLDFLACLRSFKTCLLDSLNDAAQPSQLISALKDLLTTDSAMSILSEYQSSALDVLEALHGWIAFTDMLLNINNNVSPASVSAVVSVASSHFVKFTEATKARPELIRSPRWMQRTPTQDGWFEKKLVTFVFEHVRPEVVDHDPQDSENNKSSRDDIWVLLTFRMWCWYVLHEFNPEDKLIVPGQFFGSEMPIYIG